jgi:hypothetical protein
LPAPESLAWGEDALARDFAGARALFNAALPSFRDGLKFYALDGFVTEHVHILLDISNLYRRAAPVFPSIPYLVGGAGCGRACATYCCPAVVP